MIKIDRGRYIILTSRYTHTHKDMKLCMHTYTTHILKMKRIFITHSLGSEQGIHK